MNHEVVRFKLERDRRGVEPENTREALTDHCVPSCRGRRVLCPRPLASRLGLVKAGQGRSRQVNLEKFMQGVDHAKPEGARTKAAVNARALQTLARRPQPA